MPGLASLIPKKRDQKSETNDKGRAAIPPAPTPASSGLSLAGAGPSHASAGWPHREEFGRRMSAPPEIRSAAAAHAPVPRVGESIFQIEIEKIRPNPYQPRREFNEEELRALAESIRALGIIQPVVVSKVVRETATGTDVEYQLIAGERRFLAAKIAGLERVPAIVKNAESRAKLEMALVENVQRSDLGSLETARAYSRLQEEFGLTQREVGARVGKSREVVANATRLLGLPLPVQEALARGRINESQARTLLSLPGEAEQLRALESLLRGGMTVRALREDIVGKRAAADPETSYWERKLEEELGVSVKVTKRGEKGKLSIRFFSESEWRSLVDRLLGGDERV